MMMLLWVKWEAKMCQEEDCRGALALFGSRGWRVHLLGLEVGNI